MLLFDAFLLNSKKFHIGDSNMCLYETMNMFQNIFTLLPPFPIQHLQNFSLKIFVKLNIVTWLTALTWIVVEKLPKFPRVDAGSCFIVSAFNAVCFVDKKNYLCKNCVLETYYNIEDITVYCYIEIMVEFVYMYLYTL